MRRAAIALLTAGLLTGCSGDGAPASGSGTSGSGAVAVVESFDDVAYYYACGNETLDLDGRRWYPLVDQQSVDASRYEVQDEVVGAGAVAYVGALTVAVRAPLPGEDVGTLTIHGDGMARFESDSGIVAWLTERPVTYNWEC